MRPIFKTVYGSFLYGTNVATSDQDIKGVMVPTADDILDGEIHKTFTDNTNSSSDRRNTADDTDLQLYSLKKFLHDISTGQSYAMELLFSPQEKWVGEVDPIWLEIVKNRDKFVSKNITAMVSYARAQAFKYGDKGRRLEVFKDVVECLRRYEDYYKGTFKIRDCINPESGFGIFISKHKEFISIHTKENDSSGVEYLDVNGVMVPLGSTTSYALDVYIPRLEEYGHRAKKAMEDKGQDLKAIYHAVRIAYQAEELLLTGKITLPRPEAPLLLDIRQGKFEEAKLKELIDESFEKVREAEKISSLPAKVDKDWIKQFGREINLNIIMKDKNLDFDGSQAEEAFFKATQAFGW